MASFPRALTLAVVGLTLLLAACGGLASSPAPAAASTGGAIAPAATTTYVAIGASDAYGIGTSDPDRLNWPMDLTADLGAGVHLVNLGIPGETLSAALQNEVPIAIAQQPQIITIWLAVNDIIDQVPLAAYQADLRQLLSTLHQQTTGTGPSGARIYVANLPDLTALPYFHSWDQAALRAEVASWNSAIASTVSATGAHLVDLTTAWSELANHPEYLSGDGLHPSDSGARRLAAIFAAAIGQGA